MEIEAAEWVEGIVSPPGREANLSIVFFGLLSGLV